MTTTAPGSFFCAMALLMRWRQRRSRTRLRSAGVASMELGLGAAALLRARAEQGKSERGSNSSCQCALRLPVVRNDQAGEMPTSEGNGGTDQDVPGERECGMDAGDELERCAESLSALSQRARLTTKPQTMPTMAPVWVA